LEDRGPKAIKNNDVSFTQLAEYCEKLFLEGEEFIKDPTWSSVRRSRAEDNQEPFDSFLMWDLFHRKLVAPSKKPCCNTLAIIELSFPTKRATLETLLRETPEILYSE
jgi:hypothetical protein